MLEGVGSVRLFFFWFVNMPRSRTLAADLAKVLNDAQAPVYVVDDWRQIVFCNQACAAWTRTKVDELVGQACAFRTPSEPAVPSSVAAELCPPPAVFAGTATSAVVAVSRPDGSQAFRRGHFFPLGQGDDECPAVIAVLEIVDCPAPSLDEAANGPPPGDGQLHDAVRRFRRQMAGRFGADSLIGTSPAIAKARAQVELAAGSKASVLVVGPAGSGKDHVARAIHYASLPAAAPAMLVPLDCAVLETNLFRSTLRALKSKLTAARPSGATLILNDVDHLAGEAQDELVELVRGAARPLRIVATAERSLTEAVRERKFSAALAAALATITIELPPLAERAGDVPQLAQLFLEEANTGRLKQLGGFTSDALDALASYGWPGNVDELAAVVRAAHEQAAGGEVTTSHLPRRLQLAAHAVEHGPRSDAIDLEALLARIERELIERALKRSKGNKSKAAKLLGLTRPRLYRRLVQLGLEEPSDKSAADETPDFTSEDE
jgi:transcriptional regulator with AAA-type ATPase domain